MGKSTKTPVRSVKPAKQVIKGLSDIPASEVALVDSPSIQQEEKVYLDDDKKEGFRKIKIQNDILQAQLDKLNKDNTSRGKMGDVITIIVSGWLVLVMTILFLTGFKVIELSDKVLITLLATTSVNVIGLLVIVSNYLFNKSKST